MLQNASRPHPGLRALLRHLGVFGLFLLAIVDSSPMPTLGGPDILAAILAFRHLHPWYEIAAIATAGSAIGAYLTFRLARRAGKGYLHSRFGEQKTLAFESFFREWGTGALAASTALPIPFPTSLFFAAAGAGGYRTGRFLTIVVTCRAIRYSAVSLIGHYYGRHFIRVLRHPSQHWGWLLVFIGAGAALAVSGMLLNRRFRAQPAT